MAKTPPPASFIEKMHIPEAMYRTALAIKHDVRMRDVDAIFVLGKRDDQTATYTAICPRCNAGEISVTVALAPDGSFAEVPACPMLCLDCEDALDAMLEPEVAPDPVNGSGDRGAFSKRLKMMNTRSWE